MAKGRFLLKGSDFSEQAELFLNSLQAGDVAEPFHGGGAHRRQRGELGTGRHGAASSRGCGCMGLLLLLRGFKGDTRG